MRGEWPRSHKRKSDKINRFLDNEANNISTDEKKGYQARLNAFLTLDPQEERIENAYQKLLRLKISNRTEGRNKLLKESKDGKTLEEVIDEVKKRCEKLAASDAVNLKADGEVQEEALVDGDEGTVTDAEAEQFPLENEGESSFAGGVSFDEIMDQMREEGMLEEEDFCDHIFS